MGSRDTSQETFGVQETRVGTIGRAPLTSIENSSLRETFKLSQFFPNRGLQAWGPQSKQMQWGVGREGRLRGLGGSSTRL